MLEQTKRISLKISSVLSKVEPDLYTGSGSATLHVCVCVKERRGAALAWVHNGFTRVVLELIIRILAFQIKRLVSK